MHAASGDLGQTQAARGDPDQEQYVLANDWMLYSEMVLLPLVALVMWFVAYRRVPQPNATSTAAPPA